MRKQAIGIFDSGLGGLTILKALRKALPHENLIYFGDTANVPYGSKSKETVSQFSLNIARFLEAEQVKLIIVACNTASALALPTLRKHIRLPIMGVIEPGAQKAAQTTQNNNIAVLGTEATVRSKAYPKTILKYAPGAKIFQQACPLFVPLVEENWHKKPMASLVAREYLSAIQKTPADTVILGCTHYPVLKPVLTKILGRKIKLVDSSDTTAEAARKFLTEKHLLENIGRGTLTVYTSDDPKRFKRLAGHLLGEEIGTVRLKKLNV